MPNADTLKEKDHGKLLATWLRRRNIFFCHIPNEGARSLMENMSLLQQGLEPGACDYLIFRHVTIFDDTPGAAIELKRVGWKPRSAKDKARFMLQKQFLARLEERGWKTKVCYGWEDAVRFLEDLGYGGEDGETNEDQSVREEE